MSSVRFRYSASPSGILFLCSSAVEPSTVNRLVAGSNPAGGVRAISAVVAHLLYTERVGGSNPSSPMINKSLALNWMKNDVSSKMQRLQQRVNWNN